MSKSITNYTPVTKNPTAYGAVAKNPTSFGVISKPTTSYSAATKPSTSYDGSDSSGLTGVTLGDMTVTLSSLVVYLNGYTTPTTPNQLNRKYATSYQPL